MNYLFKNPSFWRRPESFKARTRCLQEILACASMTLCVAVFCALSMPASAQTALDSTQPIAIDADSLEVLQSESKAIFQGNVKAVQGDMVLQSNVMTVFYGAPKGTGTAPSQGAFGSLSRIDVSGNVRMRTTGESATAARGIYDAIANKVFLFGNVVLKRGGNVLKGSKLEYSLVSGSSVLSGGVGANSTPSASSNGSRVRGVFLPGAK